MSNAAPATAAGPGPVVFLRCSEATAPQGHEIISKMAAARGVAELLGREFAGTFDASTPYSRAPYFVPDETLLLAHAHQLGIRNERQLFGGVVPHPFVATKTITHCLPDPDAQAQAGWQPAFGEQVRDVVLPGFSAFSRADALRAGALLLASGPVRLKRPGGVGGRGQSVVKDPPELEAELEAIDASELARDGVVLECNLVDVKTLSVGQARLGDMQISYCGTQRLTPANNGSQVYGGSELLVARGDWEALLGLELAPPTRLAIRQARTYHEAAMAVFDGMFASRSNYDVAQGFDAAGNGRSGVLEQSWRIGGATGAELAAIKAFQADPDLASVGACTTEIHGESPLPPDDAVVYFRGTDARVGALTKYARLHPHDDS